MKNFIILALAINTFIFLGFAFFTLHINPFLWAQETRFTFLFFSFFGIIISYPLTQIIKYSE